MSENFRGVAPLNWQRVVDEALERRKLERMTQKQHAALAGVSLPTIAAFERGETTLSLAKAFDILRVVGLLDEPVAGGAQERFLRESFERWQMLVKDLPKDSPARFPDGFYRVDYSLEGDLKHVSLYELEGILSRATTNYTGWPVFMVMTREEFRPREVDGAIETWLRPGTLIDRNFEDAAHCDYWRAVPTGRMFLMRGYQEDGQEGFEAGTVFDNTLPIWRLGEVLLHAENMAHLLAKDDPNTITIRLRALYAGLRGRQLKSWANPLSGLFLEGRPARSDEVLLEAEIPVLDLKQRLAQHLHPLVATLFERFEIESVSSDFVAREVARLSKGKF